MKSLNGRVVIFGYFQMLLLQCKIMCGNILNGACKFGQEMF